MSHRTYVIGLPVVVEVHDDGTVTYDTDVSEMSDAPFESEDLYGDDGEPIEISEDTRTEDRIRISDAIQRANDLSRAGTPVQTSVTLPGA